MTGLTGSSPPGFSSLLGLEEDELLEEELLDELLELELDDIWSST